MNSSRHTNSLCASTPLLSFHQRFQINGPDVVQDTIDGESVIVNLRTGHYYSLEKAGAVIWQLIENHSSAEEIVHSIHRLYTSENGEIEEAVIQLITELQKEDLIRPTEALVPDQRTGPSGELEHKEKFEFPFLQKYTDMQDILLLDPIHDVDETGWPNIKIDKAE